MMWGYGNGPASTMMGGGGWMAPVGMVIRFIILGLIVAGIVWLFLTLTRQSSATGRRSSSLDVLEERFTLGVKSVATNTWKRGATSAETALTPRV